MITVMEFHLRVALVDVFILLFLYPVVCEIDNKDGTPLSKFIHHFEPLNYDTTLLDMHQITQQRNNSGNINFEIFAFGRSFHLQLSWYPSIISKGAKLKLVDSEGSRTMDMTSEMYKGFVIGDKHSSAHGHIINDTFDGVIRTDGETYHIEPAFRYFASPRPGFHSVIYRMVDVRLDRPDADASGSKHCQLCSISLDSSKRSVQYSGTPNQSGLPPDKLLGLLSSSASPDAGQSGENATISPREHQASHGQPSKTCVLHIVADHTFFQQVAGWDVTSAVAEVAYHVEEANAIYRATDFDGDGLADNVGLAIGGVTVFETSSAQSYLLSGNYRDAEEFLTQFSLYDFSAYCMGLAFTYRDFSGGVLGLAWMGYPDPKGPPGGICQSQMTYRDDGLPSSLNTAMVSLVNYDAYVPRSISVASVMHELGHGFGSEHDPQTTTCTPYGLQGNYIMYSQATDGNRPNNDKFSSCSRSQMAAVIASKGPLCLQAHSGQYCGNGLIDQGEECDCGTAALCSLVDDCCTPMGGTGSDVECTLRRELGRVCSPLTSPCCDEACHIIPASSHRHCFTDNECLTVSFCNGTSAECPEPEALPDGSECDEGAKRCLRGRCTLSACYDLRYQECFCSDANHTDWSCQLCCQVGDECLPAASLGLTGAGGQVIAKETGSACDNYTGYCDLRGICVSTDTDLALDKLKNILTKEGTEALFFWMRMNWYYIICGALSICLLSLSGKISYDNRHFIQTNLRRMCCFTFSAEPNGTNTEPGVPDDLRVRSAILDSASTEDITVVEAHGLHASTKDEATPV